MRTHGSEICAANARPPAAAGRGSSCHPRRSNPDAAFEGQRPGSITAWAKARHERRPRFGTKGGTRAEGPIHLSAGKFAYDLVPGFQPFLREESLPSALPKADMRLGLWPSIAASGINSSTRPRYGWRTRYNLPGGRRRRFNAGYTMLGQTRRASSVNQRVHTE